MHTRLSSAAVVVLTLALLWVTGCASLHEPIIMDPPRFEPVWTVAGKRPLVALVLSGGSARALAHIGVIKVLEEAGIAPDIIVGSSAGSLVGVAHASGMDARQMAAAAQKLDWAVFRDFTIPNLGLPLLGGELGLIRGETCKATSQSWWQAAHCKSCHAAWRWWQPTCRLANRWPLPMAMRVWLCAHHRRCQGFLCHR